MTIDGITLHAVVAELSTIKEAKIEKIYQPERDEVMLLLHTKEGKKRLFISANGGAPRLHLTSAQKQNPKTPPNFCMVLRKYLSNGKITGIEQIGLERIVRITIEAKDEMGHTKEYVLLCEFMGKYSNIMLLIDEKILDCIHRVPLDMSSVRQVLPGMLYVPPPREKENVLDLTAQQIAEKLEQKSITLALEGFSRFSEKEVRDRTLDKKCSIEQSICVFLEEIIQESNPVIQKDTFGVPYFFSAVPYLDYPEEGREYFKTVNEAVDAFYLQKEEITLLEKKRAQLKKILKKQISKMEKRLAIQLEALGNKKKAEEYRLFGELISANLYQIKRGSSKVQVYNYYTNEQIEIILDQKISPSANVEQFFKKANKIKTAATLAKERKETFQNELSFLEELDFETDVAEREEDLEEVREDLLKYGYLEEPRKKQTKRSDPLESPRHYYTSKGSQVFAGRNNRQNDALTLRVAKEEDYWFHAKGMPGSHVILVTNGIAPSDEEIIECAGLASLLSKAKGAKAEIDYTKIKYVWKQNGAKPGMVLFKEQKTILADGTMASKLTEIL